MLANNKEKILVGAKKARGMLDKVIKMVENDEYCVDIANQINATQGLLKEANKQLLKNHLKCCGKKNLVSNDPEVVDAFIEELVRAWDVSTRK